MAGKQERAEISWTKRKRVPTPGPAGLNRASRAPKKFGASSAWPYSSSMVPSNFTFNLMPATSSVMVAGSFSFPVMPPSANACATAFSISFCELTPTFLRNLRRLRLNVNYQ